MLKMWRDHYKKLITEKKPGFDVKHFIVCGACQNIFGFELGKLKMHGHDSVSVTMDQSEQESDKYEDKFNSDPKDQYFMVPPVPSDNIAYNYLFKNTNTSLDIALPRPDSQNVQIVINKVDELTVQMLDIKAASVEAGFNLLMQKQKNKILNNCQMCNEVDFSKREYIEHLKSERHMKNIEEYLSNVW